MRGIFNYRNPSKLPSGYVKETVEACLNLAVGIKESYENINYDISNESNQD